MTLKEMEHKIAEDNERIKTLINSRDATLQLIGHRMAKEATGSSHKGKIGTGNLHHKWRICEEKTRLKRKFVYMRYFNMLGAAHTIGEYTIAVQSESLNGQVPRVELLVTADKVEI